MSIKEIIKQINVIKLSSYTTITQIKHEEDDGYYQVWLIADKGLKYILKEVKKSEIENYNFLKLLDKGVPTLYQKIESNNKTYFLLEYIEGEDLCKCNRVKLTNALDALIAIQKQTWDGKMFDTLDSFNKSIINRLNRKEYLNDPLLEKAYDKFMNIYKTTPTTLCHDDLLPFNVISNEYKAFLIDWEHCGILPYPTSFARLIAHSDDNLDSLFYMSKEDKKFGINYYYDNLLKGKGISYDSWMNTLEYFLFYEYCEWVFVGNKYNDTNGAYYKKYLPIAKIQAAKLLEMDNK